MSGRATSLFFALFLGCAQSSAERFDASIDSVGDPQHSDAGELGGDDAEVVSGPKDGGSGPYPCEGPGCEEPPPADAQVGASDGATPTVDGSLGQPDAQADRLDAGDDGAIRATFKVRQAHAALKLPLATGFRLEQGDTVKFSATGSIWPGLVGQNCNGPDGTAGAHTGAAWPLQGGPDFALVAYIDDKWTLVGKARTFVVTEPGNLYLGTNDDDNQSGDDCTSVPSNQQGFTVEMELTRASF